MRSRSLTPSLAAFAVAAALAPRDARADVSSWMAVGGGYAAQHARQAGTTDLAPALTYSFGVGSSPAAPFVLGGGVRGQTFFGLGTDLGLAARAATGPFARGDWGLALDLGAAWRSWRTSTYGEWPVEAVLTAGSPWGLQIAVGVEVSSVPGGPPADGVFAAIEIDLLRLTVMRQGSSDAWWYNPSPAGGRADDAPTSSRRP